MGKKLGLAGMKFGKLTAIRPTENRASSGSVVWECQCDCGNKTFVNAPTLNGGKTISCGCARMERVLLSITKHGQSYTKLYGVWGGIKERCFNSNSKSYENYGGRGITVCAEWKDDFLTFKEWAMRNGYKQGLSIDRKNNNLGYYPENCQWADKKTQQNNRRANHFISLNGVKKTVKQWEEITGIKANTIIRRIRSGWASERAILTPLYHGENYIKMEVE